METQHPGGHARDAVTRIGFLDNNFMLHSNIFAPALSFKESLN